MYMRVVEILVFKNFLDDKPLKDLHCPEDVLLFGTFVSNLAHLAFHIYHEELK